ncbi:MAG: ATP-dependent helicase [Clostridia bacterium]|nr:ATP-dependent helicase [Clostridia bacterium]
MKLTDEQLKAINHIDGHLQIIACAGSGKTTVISKRIANILKQKPEIDPHNIVAFTFTEKAAVSLKRHIEDAVGRTLPTMYIGTIHAFCKHLLDKYAFDFADFTVLDTVKNHLFVTRYADKCGMSLLNLKPCLLNNTLFCECVEKLIDDYENRPQWTDTQRAVLEQYTRCLYEHQYIDFSLLISEALRQISKNASVQAYLQQIKYLVVDEYQDVNDLQEKLVRSIAHFGANVCVVGDDDQTIYQFRGSDADHMIAFSTLYPNVTKVNLGENFRCQAEILDVASKVIAHNEHRLQKQMKAHKTKSDGVVRAEGYADDQQEFEAISTTITELHEKGLPYRDMAILVRKGKFIPQIAKALEEKGVPYTADSAESFFESPYFNRLVRTLQILVDINKSALYEQWEGIANHTNFTAGFRYLRSCSIGGNHRLSEILCRFCDAIGFLDKSVPDLSIRTEDLEGLCTILNDYDEIYGDYQLSARITGVLKFLDTQVRLEYKYHNFRTTTTNEDAVQLMTVHKSKGLEFHTVFLPCLNKREFPVLAKGGRKYYHVLGNPFNENKAKYESDIEDERKLFYVAVTRAEHNLYLSYTLANASVSEFVAEAAESSYLGMDRNDLHYQPPRATKRSAKTADKDFEELCANWEREQQEKAEYWEAVRYAREALYNYYHVGNHFCPGMIMEYSDICKQGPEAILEAACRL